MGLLLYVANSNGQGRPQEFLREGVLPRLRKQFDWEPTMVYCHAVDLEAIAGDGLGVKVIVGDGKQGWPSVPHKAQFLIGEDRA